MARRKRTTATTPHDVVPWRPLDLGWVVSDVYTLPNGKTLTLGTEIAVRGERGSRFRFYSHTVTPDGREWVDVMGGPTKVTMWRSFRPDRISRVFRVAKTKATAALATA